MYFKLAKKDDFARVAKQGQPFFVRELGFKVLKNNLQYNRFGIVINLQVNKKAVIRNQIRRQIRSIVQNNSKKLKIGYDVMILTRASIKNLKFNEIQEKLLFLFKKSKILTNISQND